MELSFTRISFPGLQPPHDALVIPDVPLATPLALLSAPRLLCLLLAGECSGGGERRSGVRSISSGVHSGAIGGSEGHAVPTRGAREREHELGGEVLAERARQLGHLSYACVRGEVVRGGAHAGQRAHRM